jgi:hypothetical protein
MCSSRAAGPIGRDIQLRFVPDEDILFRRAVTGALAELSDGRLAADMLPWAIQSRVARTYPHVYIEVRPLPSTPDFSREKWVCFRYARQAPRPSCVPVSSTALGDKR